MAGMVPGGVPPSDEQAVLQFKEFLSNYNKLTEHCFKDCVHDFTTRKIHDSENSCSTNCMEKYMKVTARISQRFQEYHFMQNEAQGIPQAPQPQQPAQSGWFGR
ncbi:unnamed protein product [Owenia fusiformis]|uniref:Mitochondrial import inner membrane translocase subunit n=1 Tax=Owenia fusiformis TaxID=6347 RepID=A0A8J1U2M7_OWEFU|nr:unnamed protein product [Owenia fusiformis]